MLSKQDLRAKLIAKIPDWIKACEDETAASVILHQDAFAPNHEPDEIELLGWAIKYAGLCGKSVQIVPPLSVNLTDSAERV